MADESVHVHIRITSDKREIAATRRELERLSLTARALNNDFADLNDAMDDHNDRHRRLHRNSQQTNRALSQNGSSMSKLGQRARKTSKDFDILEKTRKGLAKGLKTGLKFALIGATIEMVAMGAAIASVNGLLAIGNATMKTYRWLMQGVAYAAAAGVAALATFAAAQREYNAALQAFNYKGVPALGAGVNQSMAALRNLTSDSRVAVFGMQNLNAAFANVSKSAELTRPMQDALAGLGDFAVAAGGDIGKNFAAAAEFIGLLKKEGSVTENVLSAASSLGPKFSDALKKSGKTGADEIIAMISAGTLAQEAGVTGALSTVNNTLMGQAKAFFTEIQSRFADLGQLFLPDTKRAFEDLQSIIRVTFSRISADVTGFGTGKLLDDIVKITDRLADFFVNLFEKYLPRGQALFGGLGKMFESMKRWWDRFVAGLEGLSEAGKVLTDTFGPVFGEMFRGFGTSLNMFGELIVENRGKFMDFRDGLIQAIQGIQQFFNGFKQVIVANLPLISTLIGGVGQLLGMLGQLFGGMSQRRGAFGALASLAGFIGLSVGIGKIAPNSKLAKPGRLAGNVLGNRAGREAVAQTINARIVYLNTNRVINGGMGGRTGGGIGGGIRGGGLGGGTDGGAAMGSFKERAYARFDAGLQKYGPMVGSMLGLGLMSQFADKSSNPFIAGGAMLGMINPYAGLALGGIGTSVTSTGATGILSGMAGGAALGQLVPGVGPVIGAIAGTGIGGLSTMAKSKTMGGGMASGAIGGGAAGLGAGAVGSYIASGTTASIASAAGLGAAFGSWAPVIGTAIGAAIGVAIGGTVGYFANQAANRDRARAAAREKVYNDFAGRVAKGVYSGEPGAGMAAISAAAEKNDKWQTAWRFYKTLGKDIVLPRLTDEGREVFENQKNLGSYFQSMQKQTEGLIALEPHVQRAEEKINELSGATGKSAKEIGALAEKMGVDLIDPTKTLTDNLNALGLAVVKTSQQLADSQREIYAKTGENIFKSAKDFEESQKALNQAAEGIRQSGKNASPQQVREFVATLYDQALLLNKGDASKAQAYMQRAMFGGAGGTDRLAGEQFQNALGPLYGLEEIFQQVLVGDAYGRTVQEALLQGILENTKRFNEETASNIMTAMVGGGVTVAGGGTGNKDLNNLIQKRILELQAARDNPYVGDLFGYNQSQIDALQSLGTRMTETGLKGEDLAFWLENELGSLGVATGTGADRTLIDLMGVPGPGEALTGTAKEFHDAIIGAAKEGIGKTPDWMSSPPGWYNGAPVWWQHEPDWYRSGDSANDTRSPRAVGDTLSSALGRTMARHSYFNGMFPGKRSVTSAYRNFSLGSLNSDHLTGNAYDLVGQNLVGYANAVNGMGGFAEFHGSGADRHLHVVPGQTPIGDSVSPMTPMVVGGGGGGTYSYNINVYPTAGQDPAAIAQEVMNRIEAKEKSTRERS